MRIYPVIHAHIPAVGIAYYGHKNELQIKGELFTAT